MRSIGMYSGMAMFDRFLVKLNFTSSRGIWHSLCDLSSPCYHSKEYLDLMHMVWHRGPRGIASIKWLHELPMKLQRIQLSLLRVLLLTISCYIRRQHLLRVKMCMRNRFALIHIVGKICICMSLEPQILPVITQYVVSGAPQVSQYSNDISVKDRGLTKFDLVTQR